MRVSFFLKRTVLFLLVFPSLLIAEMKQVSESNSDVYKEILSLLDNRDKISQCIQDGPKIQNELKLIADLFTNLAIAQEMTMNNQKIEKEDIIILLNNWELVTSSEDDIKKIFDELIKNNYPEKKECSSIASFIICLLEKILFSPKTWMILSVQNLQLISAFNSISMTDDFTDAVSRLVNLLGYAIEKWGFYPAIREEGKKTMTNFLSHLLLRMDVYIDNLYKIDPPNQNQIDLLKNLKKEIQDYIEIIKLMELARIEAISDNDIQKCIKAYSSDSL